MLNAQKAKDYPGLLFFSIEFSNKCRQICSHLILMQSIIASEQNQ